jgi:hypothetical protein
LAKPEYLLAVLLLILIIILTTVVAVAAIWLIVKPEAGFFDLQSILNPTTTTVSTTTSTTTSSTSTSTSTTSTSTTESTTTTLRFYVCDDSIMETGMIPTRCQRKPTPGTTFQSPGEWYETNIRCSVTYALKNTLGGYDEFRSKIEGVECFYVQSDIRDCSFSSQVSCVIPQDLNATRSGTLISK